MDQSITLGVITQCRTLNVTTRLVVMTAVMLAFASNVSLSNTRVWCTTSNGKATVGSDNWSATGSADHIILASLRMQAWLLPCLMQHMKRHNAQPLRSTLCCWFPAGAMTVAVMLARSASSQWQCNNGSRRLCSSSSSSSVSRKWQLCKGGPRSASHSPV